MGRGTTASAPTGRGSPAYPKPGWAGPVLTLQLQGGSTSGREGNGGFQPSRSPCSPPGVRLNKPHVKQAGAPGRQGQGSGEGASIPRC